MKWLGFLLPRSLRARLILLVLGSVLVAQALTLYALALHQQTQIQAAATNLLVTSITTLQSTLSMVPPGHRERFVRNTSQGQWQLLQRPPPREARFQSDDGLDPFPAGSQHLRQSLRKLARDVNRALGGSARVAVSADPQPFLYVSIGQPGSTQWLKIPLDRVDPPLTRTTVGWWLAGLAGLLLIAVGFSWHISRPITRLLKATDDLAKGNPQPVEPSGPAETRQLGARFNAMLDSLRQSQQSQRALLAGLPHDLKGPLARMALRIEMTDDESLKEGLRRDLHDMQQMVEQFLHFLRGQDADRLSCEPLRLDQWLSERISESQALGEPVQWVGDKPTVTVSADPVALGRLLSNLISNALEHGRPPVEVSLRALGADEVEFSVSDHGPGIAAKDRARAFEPFERLDAARTRTGNVGLGLSLAKGIAIAHGGRLELDQAASGGLSARVVLPRLV
jgi:two-component system, OmpR family, osmolarity sensor histidine kinase EnvZ